jgi:hypothetical protein
MTVWAIAHRARCDSCGITRDNANYFALKSQAEGEGWVFGRKKDGERAKRGGKDYCASCKPVRESTKEGETP